MSAEPEPLLILATSGRALAESACRGGWRPRVIDAFADEDTRRAAAGVTAVPLASSGLAPGAVLRAAARLCPARGGGVVYGSGIEAQPELLEELSRGRRLLGNTAQVLRTVKDPPAFFALLDELAIPHPEVVFRAAAAGPGWVAKRAAGSGGGHVRPVPAGHVPSAGSYLQRETAGQAMSLLFLADGCRSRALGFNTLRTAPDVPGRPYLYGGAVSRAALAPKAREAVCAAAAALTRALGLRGLNGLDFIDDGERGQVLELNPRPGASFELYDPETPCGLLKLHVQACGGRLPAWVPARASRVRAVSIAYAPRAARIRSGFAWPAWCRDRPTAGQTIRGGEPICSVYAEAQDARRAESEVHARRKAVLESLAWQREIA